MVTGKLWIANVSPLLDGESLENTETIMNDYESGYGYVSAKQLRFTTTRHPYNGSAGRYKKPAKNLYLAGSEKILYSFFFLAIIRSAVLTLQIRIAW